MPRFPVIAIDGPAGSGKSTAARLLARKLGFTHVDTGALYRAVTWLAIERGVDLADEKSLAAVVPDIDVRFEEEKVSDTLAAKVSDTFSSQRVFSGPREITDAIRTPELTRQVRHAAASPLVRGALAPVQRAFAEKSACVMEGRDIGTVIFPDAQVKFYLDAPPLTRAERRWKELAAKGQKVTLAEVERQAAARDASDLRRSVSPLRQAADAIVVDTGGMTIEQMVERLAELAASRLPPAARRARVSPFYRVCRLMCIVLARTFFRLKTWGLENVPLSGGAIIASNHQSYMDPPLAGCLIRRQCNFLARSTLFRFGPFAWLIRNVGAVPLERGESDAAGLRRAVDMLQAGHLLVLFPEGTRSRDGCLGKIQAGVATIAARAGVPVVPAYIHGAFDAWPRTRKLPRPGRVGVFYGRPIPPAAGSEGEAGRKDRARQLTEEIQRALEELERAAFENMPLKRRSAPGARCGPGQNGPGPVDPTASSANREAPSTGRPAPADGNRWEKEPPGTGSAGAAPGVESHGET